MQIAVTSDIEIGAKNLPKTFGTQQLIANSI